MTKKFLFYLVFLISILLNIICLEKHESIKSALESYPGGNSKEGKKAKYLHISIFKEKWGNIDYLSRIIYQFFLLNGAKVHLVNMGDEKLLGICPEDAEIDKEVVLETFHDLISGLEIKNEAPK